MALRAQHVRHAYLLSATQRDIGHQELLEWRVWLPLSPLSLSTNHCDVTHNCMLHEITTWYVLATFLLQLRPPNRTLAKHGAAK